MTIKPLSDRVLVKIEQAETKTGTVCAVGPGTEKEKITVSPGQKVMYDKYAGAQVKIDGVEHLILKMADIVAIIE